MPANAKKRKLPSFMAAKPPRCGLLPSLKRLAPFYTPDSDWKEVPRLIKSAANSAGSMKQNHLTNRRGKEIVYRLLSKAKHLQNTCDKASCLSRSKPCRSSSSNTSKLHIHQRICKACIDFACKSHLQVYCKVPYSELRHKAPAC